ncbi:MAG: VWA-like domain-containing protein [Coprococcus sp.]
MHEMKEKLIRAGTGILNASRTELYVAMRFLDIALNSLDYEMDLSMKTIGTDSQKIRFNPRYLIENYQNDSVLVNRAYLHMILHCVFRHMFHNKDKDQDVWNLSCDIAVTAIIDDMEYRCIRLTVPDERQAMYDRLHGEMKVLTAEGIYKSLKKRPMTWLEMESARKQFTVDDHVFWDSEQEDQKDSNSDNQNNNEDNQENDQQNQNNNQKDNSSDQKQSEREKQWQEISEKMRTNMETCSKDAAEMAGSLYDYIKIATRERYDYRRFLKKFTTLREEIRLDLDSYDYIYYTYGLTHYGNMPLIESLEYKEVKKIEELAIVIDTSESCSGDYVRRFLEETFAILSNHENFFRKMNVHIIQCDAKAQVDDVITCEDDMKRYMENFRLIGFGGTDFRPAFEYVNELCRKKIFKHLKGMLYFTDGYGTYPERRPDYDVAFIFLEESYNDRHVPPWAIKLILGPDDIRMGGIENEH